MGWFQRGCSGPRWVPRLAGPLSAAGTFPTVAAGPGLQPRDVSSPQRLRGQPSCPEASVPQLRGPGAGAPLRASPSAGRGAKAKFSCSLKLLVLSAPGSGAGVLGGTGATPCATVTCLSDPCVRGSRVPWAALRTPVRGAAPRSVCPRTPAGSAENGSVRMGTRGKKLWAVSTGEGRRLPRKPSAKVPVSRERPS